MQNIHFTVSLNGRFYFRTDAMSALDLPANLEKDLATRFPAREGFKISKLAQPAIFTVYEVNNA